MSLSDVWSTKDVGFRQDETNGRREKTPEAPGRRLSKESRAEVCLHGARLRLALLSS